MNLSLGFGLDKYRVQDGTLLNQNEPEVDLYITGLSTELSTGQIAKLNTFVAAIKTGLGITALSDAFDILYLLAGETSESSLKNLVKDAHHCTAMNSPVFTAFQGFKGNGTNMHIKTGYIPATHGVKYTLNDAAASAMLVKDAAGEQMILGVAGDHDIFVWPLSGSKAMVKINDNTSGTYTSSVDNKGFYITQRTASNARAAYLNNVEKKADTQASTGLPPLEVYLLAANVNGSSDYECAGQLGFAAFGRSMSSPERAALQSAYEAYIEDQEVLGVIIDGQSNASGQGLIADLPEYLTGVIEGCYIWKDSAWQPLETGVNQDGYSDCVEATRHGSELELAYRLHEETGKDIYILKSGFGSTYLAEQAGTNDHAVTSVAEYHDYIGNRYAAANLGKIKWLAYIWAQGETDANNETAANAYQVNMAAKVAGIRSKFATPRMPVIIDRIGSWSASTFKDTVRTAQDAVNAADTKVFVVDTDAMANDGSQHLTSAGYVARGLAEFTIIKDNLL